MKVAELEGVLLDWWVFKIEHPKSSMTYAEWGGQSIPYSESWAWGGPIIEREKIATWFTQGQWQAAYGDPVGAIELRGPDGRGPTLLIAAMRAFVREKFGDEVPDMADAQPGSDG